jgi:hypothetical protein
MGEYQYQPTNYTKPAWKKYIPFHFTYSQLIWPFLPEYLYWEFFYSFFL